MDRITEDLSNRRLRHFVFYRYQTLSSFVLFIAIGFAISITCALVTSSESRIALSLLLVILGVAISAAQLLTVAFSFSTVLKPIEYLFSAIQEWSGEVGYKKHDEISIDNIRLALQKLVDQSNIYYRQWPKEVVCLQNTFINTLQAMESAWQKMETDTIMVGLGGVCSQVAHDMRSPIGVIKAGACLALKAETPEDRKMANNLIEMSTTRLNKMADELLEYRKATAVECKPMDLSAVVNGICQELGHVAHGKNVQLDIHVPEGQDFFGDGDKLGRVLQNLMSNAIQAVERQGDGQVQVQMHRSEDHILLNIRDNGPGIPSEYADQMFKAGFTTKGKSGNGLGLIYCANVVKAHGGQITASNRPEGGAEIAISLPYETAH